jgi:radical SAM superfamily enzyme YgiQ (UPF0313 family)
MDTVSPSLNILLVLPEWRMTSNRWKLSDHPYVQKKAFVPPLSLATIAALTPPGHRTDIWDESVHGLIDQGTVFERDYDLVGVGGYITSIFRAKEVARLFRSRGIPVVAGGAGATASPELYDDEFDALILGESERAWPRFVEAFAGGVREGVFRDPETVDMALSPPPDWRSLTSVLAESYAVGGVQTTRGCPFICEFCNVWKVFGRKMRTKPVAQVIDEVAALHRLGVRVVSFCEDNFYGARRYCKEVLAGLIALNESLGEPLRYYAEISINIARDEEVLELLAEARFAGLFIGVESPNRASLEETAKVQNLKGDLVETCRKIQSYGLPIEASMIVGFDHDDASIFDLQFEFFEAANIALPRVRMLQARPGTDTFDKLLAEGRVLDAEALHEPGSYFDNYLIPNILPRGMSRIELFERYIPLMERTLDWDNFTKRMRGYLEGITYEPALRRTDGRVGCDAPRAEGLRGVARRSGAAKRARDPLAHGRACADPAAQRRHADRAAQHRGGQPAGDQAVDSAPDRVRAGSGSRAVRLPSPVRPRRGPGGRRVVQLVGIARGEAETGWAWVFDAYAG